MSQEETTDPLVEHLRKTRFQSDPLVEQLVRTSGGVIDEGIGKWIMRGAIALASAVAIKKLIWPVVKDLFDSSEARRIKKKGEEEISSIIMEAIMNKPSKMSVWPEDELLTTSIHFRLHRWDTINRMLDALEIGDRTHKLHMDDFEHKVGGAIWEISRDEGVSQEIEEVLVSKHPKWREQARREFNEWQEQDVIGSDGPPEETTTRHKPFEVAWKQSHLRPLTNPTKNRKWSLSFAKDLRIYR